jgi:hypothetical protein
MQGKECLKLQTELIQWLRQAYGLTDDFTPKPLGQGHIHQTFLASGQRPVVLQQMNTQVFPDTAALMANLTFVTNHLHHLKQASGYGYDVLNIFPNLAGQCWVEDATWGAWRAFDFKQNALTLETVTKVEQAYEAARAFGTFNRAFFDTDPKQLKPLLPDFHNIHVRFEQLEAAKQQADPIRQEQADATLDWAYLHHTLILAFDLLVVKGLPQRITHNDTKINNVLMDATTNMGLCVIDLDTVMPGYLMYDFGDMVRSMTCREPEDSLDLDRIQVRIDMLSGVISGYLTPLGDVITQLEIESLALGAKLIPYLLGVRFLTDYLRGDVYFKAHYPEHNLVRARNQFALLESITAHDASLEKLLSANIV